MVRAQGAALLATGAVIASLLTAVPASAADSNIVVGIDARVDLSGDSSNADPRTDITTYSVKHRVGEAWLTLKTVGMSNPRTDPVWRDGHTLIVWTFSRGSQEPALDEAAIGWVDANGQLHGAIVDTNGDIRPQCPVTFSFSASGGYKLHLPWACYGYTVQYIRGLATIGIGDAPNDAAPDTGFTHFVTPQAALPFWSGWDIARGVALLADGKSGYIVDGYGTLHPYSDLGVATPAATNGPHWRGFTIARGVAVLPNGKGGYVLDGYGAVHPFSVGANGKPAAARLGPYWPGWDIARGVALTSDGKGGYVTDAFGGIHPFAIGANPVPTVPHGGGYWPGWDIVRGITTTSAGGGFLLDAFGALHPFTTGGSLPGAIHGGLYWPGRDFARGVDYDSARHRGTIVDAFGGLHTFAGP